MKIKLFLSASLTALGLWLAAAFLHNVDVASYQAKDATPKAAKMEAAPSLSEAELEPVIETASID